MCAYLAFNIDFFSLISKGWFTDRIKSVIPKMNKFLFYMLGLNVPDQNIFEKKAHKNLNKFMNTYVLIWFSLDDVFHSDVQPKKKWNSRYNSIIIWTLLFYLLQFITAELLNITVIYFCPNVFNAYFFPFRIRNSVHCANMVLCLNIVENVVEKNQWNLFFIYSTEIISFYINVIKKERVAYRVFLF